MPVNANKEVRVRMYRQGLGDCFLITFPRDPEPFHMLLDCGALKSKHYDTELMKEVVDDIKTETGGRLDIVAATHEHWDHISGFYDAEKIFKEFAVERVWVAWTEQPNNKAAKLLKEKFKKEKKAVEMALARMPNDKKNQQLRIYKRAITELFGFFGGLGATAGKSKKGVTDQAWDIMLGLGKKQYCDPQKRPLEFEGVEGVRVYVLGPPEDPDYIAKRLSKTETYEGADHGFTLTDSFLAAVSDEGVDAEAKELAAPFDTSHRILPAAAKKSAFFKERYGFSASSKNAWRRIDHDWLNLAGELALHLDSYTNNTCLAFAIELVESGKVLLFPGDAQVGNWLSWGDRSWKVKDSEGKTNTVKSSDLLSRTVLYKVGHHGSHNATLRAKGLELMESPELVAMIPVHRKTAKDQDWEFPYQKLWDRLKIKARGRVLLADASGLNEIASEAQEQLSASEWKQFKKFTSFNKLYVEYRISY
jgi:hypothetical protein